MVEKILITGITGFVGSHMADYLLETQKDVKIYGTRRWHLSKEDNIKGILDKISMFDCDLTDPIGTRELIRAIKPDRIFHFAAESFVSPSWKHPSRYMTMNYIATVNLLDAMHEYCPDARILIPGSGEEYGDINEEELPIVADTVLRPVNPYAVTKIAQDLIGYVYHKSYGLNVIRTRAFNHEGPRRDKVFGIPWYAYQVAKVERGQQEPLLKVGHLDDRRNFTHVKDIVKAYWLANQSCETGKMYLIGSMDEDKIYTFRQALEKLIDMSSVHGINYEIDSQYVRPTNVPRLIADTKEFNDVTGWQPEIPFQTILEDTLAYWRLKVATQ